MGEGKKRYANKKLKKVTPAPSFSLEIQDAVIASKSTIQGETNGKSST